MEKPRFQFGLKGMFEATAAAAASMALVHYVPAVILVLVVAVHLYLVLQSWFLYSPATCLPGSTLGFPSCSGGRSRQATAHPASPSVAMPRMQFSIRTLLAVVTVVGIGAALWTAKPSWWVGAVEVLFVAWVLASAIILAVNSTGKFKAWWIGIAVGGVLPTIFWLASLGTFIHDPPREVLFNASNGMQLFSDEFLPTLFYGFRLVILGWAFAPVVGLLCVFTHWLFIRSAGVATPKD